MTTEVTTVGEVIVDFVSTASGTGLQKAPGFIKAAGGAPANVAIGLARLGTRSAFIGKVGADSFGRFLESTLRREGVNTRGLRFDRIHKTRLAFVSLDASGGREFEFWERFPADEQLSASDVSPDVLSASKVVHISSFMLLKKRTRTTVRYIASVVRKKHRLLSFDPNLRLDLWESHRQARQQVMEMVGHSDIVKLNAGEARFLTGRSVYSRAASHIRSSGPSLVVITDGPKGCFFQTEKHEGKAAGFRVRAVDTTGCGDAFLAGLLHGIVRNHAHPSALNAGELLRICQYANAVGALTSLQRGAITALPTAKQVDRLLTGRHGRAQ